MTTRTLVVDQGRQPHDVISWQDAVGMVVDGKAEVLKLWDTTLQKISLDSIASWEASKQFSETLFSWFLQCDGDGDFIEVRIPAVVQLIRRITGRRPKVRLTRGSIMARDRLTCQYCGQKRKRKDLNLDHVVPKAHGGKTRWDNLVTSCITCNTIKAAKTLEQAGMTLLKQPTRPHSLSEILFRMEFGNSVPDPWVSFCYWNVSLDES